jgi:phenylacetate-CoA ligase
MNADMPLIRYEAGDRGALASGQDQCSCGRSLPVLERVEGRLDDVLLTRDGRRIGRLDPVFKADLPIREAQIVQESLDLFKVRIVPAQGYKPKDGEAIVKRLQDRLGRIEVVLELVERIPRSANGKFRAVVSNLKK